MLEKVFESLTLEVCINNTKCIISNVYRSPTPVNNVTVTEHQSNFIEKLDVHLNNLALLDKNSYVFLDSNINLLNINHNVTTQLYLETVYSNGYSQVIGKATRIQNHSYSLIDHILVKNRSNNTKVLSGTLITDISDHFMNFICIDLKCKSTGPKFITTRDFSAPKIENFRDNLRNVRWGNVISYDDTNVCFNNFWTDFSVMYDLHFPSKRIKFNKNFHKINQFMTPGLLVSRRNKLLLQKKSIANPDLYHVQYRNYRNLYNSVLRAIKKMYVDENFKKYQGTLKKRGIFSNKPPLGKLQNKKFRKL
jgi:hypothetical protein